MKNIVIDGNVVKKFKDLEIGQKFRVDYFDFIKTDEYLIEDVDHYRYVGVGPVNTNLGKVNAVYISSSKFYRGKFFFFGPKRKVFIGGIA